MELAYPHISHKGPTNHSAVLACQKRKERANLLLDEMLETNSNFQWFDSTQSWNQGVQIERKKNSVIVMPEVNSLIQTTISHNFK
jgi:hypothetical protein